MYVNFFRKYWCWLLTLLYVFFIFYQSMQTGEASGSFSQDIAQMIIQYIKPLESISFEDFHFFIRKLAHFSEYAILAIFVILSYRKQPLPLPFLLVLMLFMVVVPCVDETIQHFTPNRYGALQDVLLDMSGYCFVSIVYLFINKSLSN